MVGGQLPVSVTGRVVDHFLVREFFVFFACLNCIEYLNSWCKKLSMFSDVE